MEERTQISGVCTKVGALAGMLVLGALVVFGGCPSSGSQPLSPDGASPQDHSPQDQQQTHDLFQVNTVCALYVACALKVIPTTASTVLATYGTKGSCWDQGDDTLCRDACWTGIGKLHKSHSFEPACNYCRTRADCTLEETCDTTTHRCHYVPPVTPCLPCTDPLVCCTPEKNVCEEKPEGIVCTCPDLWACTAPGGPCTQDLPLPTSSAVKDWTCTWTTATYACNRVQLPAVIRDGWTCKVEPSGVSCKTAHPPTPCNRPDGPSFWTCQVDSVLGRLSCSTK